jgi:17beta-estradiol 17-dehydrogenase / very-long-chain 3-oxoacyl-CoA reductase
MSKIRRASLSAPSAKDFVRSTLSSIGLSGGAQGRAYEMTPYWVHALLDYFAGIGGYATEVTAMKVVDYIHKDLRKRALRKRAREAGKKTL